MSKLKICNLCKKALSKQSFYKCITAKDKLRYSCKDCEKEERRQCTLKNPDKERARRQKWIEKNRDKVNRESAEWRKNNYKSSIASQLKYRKNMRKQKRSMLDWIISKYEGVPCLDCDKVFEWCAMDFDHRPEEIKSFNIASRGSVLITSERIAQIEKEITKCDLICSNCHRIRTHIMRKK